MLRLMFLLGFAAMLLVPTRAQAAPAALPFLSCAWSVPELKWEQRWMIASYQQQDQDVPLDGQTVTLHICSKPEENLTAKARLDLMAAALPRLSTISGLQYDGPAERWVLLLPDGALPADVLGDFNENTFIVRLSISTKSLLSEQWVAVHEAAHYLANGRNFSPREPWMIEGYAEYLAERVMAEMGYSERMLPVRPACSRIALREWYTQISYPYERCGYDAGGALFREIAQRAGDDTFRAITRDLANSTGVNSMRLFDELERRTATSYQDIFQHRVFAIEDDDLLAERAQLWRQLDTVIAQTAKLGVPMPAWPEVALRGWQFGGMGGWFGAANALLDATAAYTARCQALALPCEPMWRELPERSEPMLEWTSAIVARQALLGAYEPLHALAAQLGAAPPAPIAAGIAKGDASVLPQIEPARAVGTHANALLDQCRALSVACPDSWRAPWSRGEYEAADQLIVAYGKQLGEAKPVEDACGSLRASCRTHWLATLATGKPEQTRAALEQLRALLRAGAAADSRCRALGLPCDAWRVAFASGGLGAANRTLDQLSQALSAVEGASPQCQGIEPACQVIWNREFASNPEQLVRDLKALQAFAQSAAARTAACPAELGCTPMWQSALNNGQSTQQVETLLADLEHNLPLFRDALAAEQAPPPPLSLSRALRREQAGFASIAQAVQAADLSGAAVAAHTLLDTRASQRREALAVGGGLIALALGLAGMLLWRALAKRRRRSSAAAPAPTPDELLAALLAQAPPKVSKR